MSVMASSDKLLTLVAGIVLVAFILKPALKVISYAFMTGFVWGTL